MGDVRQHLMQSAYDGNGHTPPDLLVEARCVVRSLDPVHQSVSLHQASHGSGWRWTGMHIHDPYLG